MRVRRHVRRPPDLTSLFDVLFIVVFAALIRAAAVEHAAENPPKPPVPSMPIPPPAVAELRSRALVQLDAELAQLKPLVVRVTGDGVVGALEADGRRVPLDTPLLEVDPVPDRFVHVYLGDRSAELHLCQIAAVHLGVTEMSHYLVIIAPTIPITALPVALSNGLRADLDRCRIEHHAQAVLIGPSSPTAAPAAPNPPPKGPTP